jgi:hypothetical protein
MYEHGANIRDRADAGTKLHLVTDMKFYLHTSQAEAIEVPRSHADAISLRTAADCSPRTWSTSAAGRRSANAGTISSSNKHKRRGAGDTTGPARPHA